MKSIHFDRLIWQQPTEFLSLVDRNVHLWAASLDQPPIALARLKSSLSEDEIQRSQRYVRADLKQRFIVGRGILRYILSRYMGIAAGEIRFIYGPHGKPSLQLSSASDRIHFNLAHTGNLVIYAFSRACELGVDIEQVQSLPDLIQVARRFFAPQELATLLALPAEQQERAFYTCWVRKEAFIKASGKGLTQALDSFVVSLAPGQPAALLELHGDTTDLSGWSIEELPVPSGFEAALAMPATDLTLSCYSYFR